MDPVPELPKEIPPEIEMAEISERMQGLLGDSSKQGMSNTADEQLLGAVGGVGVSTSEPETSNFDHNGPIVIIVVGMAASGKTSLTQRLTAELMRRKSPPYVINLDPACNDPPYPVNIDIRDVVKYKKVMEVYNLGPNGAIVTSLNLFATKFNEVINLIEEKKKTHQYVIIDTPGQIEVFMWSASGNIITETLAARFPTVMLYVTDLVSNTNPITFISNMTYACSILYKTKLPLVITLNKCDLVDPAYAIEWLTDFTAFQSALRDREDYSSNLASSLALCLDEFYNSIDHVAVSAYDGYGMDDFFNAIQKAVSDYEKVYRPMYEGLIKERKRKDAKKQQGHLDKIKKDIKSSRTEDDSCYALPGRDAGAGLTLRLDNEDEDTSSDEELASNVNDENEEESFREVFSRRSTKQADKAGSSSSGNPPSAPNA